MLSGNLISSRRTVERKRERTQAQQRQCSQSAGNVGVNTFATRIREKLRLTATETLIVRTMLRTNNVLCWILRFRSPHRVMNLQKLQTTFCKGRKVVNKPSAKRRVETDLPSCNIICMIARSFPRDEAFLLIEIVFATVKARTEKSAMMVNTLTMMLPGG